MRAPGVPHRLDVTIRRGYEEVVDGEGARVGVLTVKKNDFGLWQYVWDRSTVAGREMHEALSSGEDVGDWGLVFRQPGLEEILASGPVTSIIEAEGRVNGVAADALSCWGVTDLTHFRERVIYPDPTVDIPLSDGTTSHTWSAFERKKTGVAEDIMVEYINENIGSLAPARRQLPCTLVVPTSLGRGPTITIAPKANANLLQIVRELSVLSGLVVDVVMTGQLELTVVIRDSTLRPGIIWSVQSGTADGLSLKRQRRSKTSVIASGSGSDATAVYVRRDATAPPLGFSELREEFIKGSGSDAAELSDDADAELAEDAGEYGLSIEPGALAPWQVGTDFNVGDRVIALVNDIEVEVPLDKVLLRHEEGTLVEEPEAGFDEETNLEPVLDDIFQRIRRLENRA